MLLDARARLAKLKIIQGKLAEAGGVGTGEGASATGIAKPMVYSAISKLERDGVGRDGDGGVKMAPQATATA